MKIALSFLFVPNKLNFLFDALYLSCLGLYLLVKLPSDTKLYMITVNTQDVFKIINGSS